MADSAQHILLGFTRLKKLGISEAITSLVESAMGTDLREQWFNYTSDSKDTPAAEKVIEFLRMRADREDSGVISAPHKPSHNKHNKPSQNKKNKGMVAASPVASLPAGPPAVATPSAGTSLAPAGTGVYNSQPKKDYPPCKYACPLCPEKHYCFHCSVFKAYSTKQKKEHAVAHHLCMNCLKPGHTAEQCRSLYRCSVCRSKHNSLLHDDSALATPVLGLASASATIPDGLLMTATVLVTGTNGVTLPARAFIDTGSSVTLISNKLKTALALKPTGQQITLAGVADFVGDVQHPVVGLTISSPIDKTWERNIAAIRYSKIYHSKMQVLQPKKLSFS